ncbi:MAG: hypothetical protein EXR48_01065 [Dehalococcoidia bacterium]|nr:hypothetical protein [Dehalococcoidia bacterium]
MTTVCTNHKKVETALRCGKCDKPICGRCAMNTEVGTRCRDCARLKRVPTYQVNPVYLVRGLVAGLAVAVGVGLLGGFLFREDVISRSRVLAALILLTMSYLTAEVVSLATNRKSGPPLQMVGVACFLAGYAVFEALIPWTVLSGLWPLMAGIVGLAIITSRLR